MYLYGSCIPFSVRVGTKQAHKFICIGGNCINDKAISKPNTDWFGTDEKFNVTSYTFQTDYNTNTYTYLQKEVSLLSRLDCKL